MQSAASDVEGDRKPLHVSPLQQRKPMVALAVGSLFLVAALPCAIVGAILASERHCTVKVEAVSDSCHQQVLHAVTASAYDQVSYAQAHWLDAHNLTTKHIDYLQKKSTLTSSDNAGTYQDHPAFDFSSSSGRRLAESPPTIPAGGNMYIPNGAEAVGSTFYLIQNGNYADNMATMGAVGTANENPSSHGGWHQGAYSPYAWVGKTSNDDVQACDFPGAQYYEKVGLDDSEDCYPPWGLMCADGHGQDVIKLKFYFLWEFDGKYVYNAKVKAEGWATDQWPEPDLQVEVLQPTNAGTADSPIADVALELTFGTGQKLSDSVSNYEKITYHLRGDGSASGAPSTGDFCTGASQGSGGSGGFTITIG